MKLVFFTPAIETSAIGRSTALVVKALLAFGHKVTLVRTEREDLLGKNTHSFNTSILKWTQEEKVRKKIQSSDIVIYQIGDNLIFHQGAVAWLEKFPGIVILHDFSIVNLFFDYYVDAEIEILNILKFWYGETIAKQFFSYSNSEDFSEGARISFPMIEWICSKALAVVTHSQGTDHQRISDSCSGPIRIIPLAYDKKKNVERLENFSEETKKFIILTIGHVNSNKRAESIIQAIGNSLLLQKNVEFHLAGKIGVDSISQLTKLAHSYCVKLVILNEVDDKTLANVIQASTVITCLRWPSIEAASASLIEALLNKKPVIVTDTTFYSDIPSSCVLKVRPDYEISDIQMQLEYLYNHPLEREQIAKNGQNWASETFTAKNYAQQLIEVAKETLIAQPLLDAMHYLISFMTSWSGDGRLLQNKETMDPLDIFTNKW